MKQKGKTMVVQGNELIESSYNVSLDEMRLLNLAISKINTKEEKPDECYRISVAEFADAFVIDRKHAYSVLRDTAKKLMRNPVQLLEIVKGKRKWVEHPWFNRLEYMEGGGSYVAIEFSKYVAPHLYNIRARYTETDLLHVAKMTSPFAVRLLSWLSKSRHLNQCKYNGGVLVHLSLADIKQQALIGDKYNDVRNLQKRLIAPAIKQINSHTDISVNYQSIREGRKIVAFEFFFIEQQKEKAPIEIIPIRPRLPRRPHVLKGSDAEGKWARQGIKLLLEYKAKLAQVDKKLTLADMRRLKDYFEILGDTFAANDVQQAIVSRQNKLLKKSA